MAQTVKNLPAMQENQVQSLGWEDPLEKGMATHSIILAWRIPWTEDPGGLQSMGLQRVRHDWGDLARTKKKKIYLTSWKKNKSQRKVRYRKQYEKRVKVISLCVDWILQKLINNNNDLKVKSLDATMWKLEEWRREGSEGKKVVLRFLSCFRRKYY